MISFEIVFESIKSVYNTQNIFIDTQRIFVLEPVGAVQHYGPYVYPAVWVDRESFVSNIGQTQGAAHGLEGRPQRVPRREGVAVVGKKKERVRGNWIRRYWPDSSTCRAVRRGPYWPDGEGGPGVYGGNRARC